MYRIIKILRSMRQKYIKNKYVYTESKPKNFLPILIIKMHDVENMSFSDIALSLFIPIKDVEKMYNENK